MMCSFADRVAGGVIGAAVGDAVGAPCECQDYRDIRNALGDYQGIEQILAAAKIGRYADTIARVAGGLIGAYRGIGAIPADWATQVVRKNTWMQLEEKTARLTEITRRKLQRSIAVAGGIVG